VRVSKGVVRMKSSKRARAAQRHVLDGTSLTPDQVYAIVHDPGASVDIAPAALARVRAANDFLKAQDTKHVVYGVTTGFGPMASHIIGKAAVKDLQYNLIRSHSVGAGAPIAEEFVLAAMVSRLNTFLRGGSGVSEGLVRHLANFINHRIAPVIPEHGAVGTSGDLVQLAHIALALIGEGEVFFEGKRRSTAAVLKKLGIVPLTLAPKEGLSLINGTAVMTGIAALLTVSAQQLVDISTRAGALALELVNGLSDAISEPLHAARPHAGQVEIARRLRMLVADSKRLRDRRGLQSRVAVKDEIHVAEEQIQEFYSLRCIPQILGPVLDIVGKVRGDVGVELNAVTDNPIIDLADEMFLHGGNFHGDYIATAVDQLKIGMVKLTILSERRINFFLNRHVNQIFPPFLNLNQPGLTLALQGVQFVATSTTAQSQSLAFPHSLHSISTNADNQDVVSMGTDAALIASKVIENGFIVLAIELIALAQAVDFAKAEASLSAASRMLYRKVREAVPVVFKDRAFSGELNAFIQAIRQDSELGIA
jgi:histidine ammonia-lyase